MRDVVMAEQILAETSLEPPPVSKLFRVLASMGYAVDSLPVSMDQAVAELTKVIEREGRHLHAHIHEHDHLAPNEAHAHSHDTGAAGARKRGR